MKVAKTLGVESIVHLITQVATRIGLALLTPLSPDIRFQYAPFIRLLILAGSGTSLIIFLTINKEFRLSFGRTFPTTMCIKQNEPIDTVLFTKNSSNVIATKVGLNRNQFQVYLFNLKFYDICKISFLS